MSEVKASHQDASSRGTLTLLQQLSGELSGLVGKTVKSVVSLSGLSNDLQSESFGSGFVFDDAGHIVTNNHVVEGCGKAMKGHLPHEEDTSVRLIGTDPATDLAVLAFEAASPVHLELRETPAQLGEICLAIGSPLGKYTESVSLGLVSGVGRSLPQPDGRRSLEHAIQTDAAVNHGNSGGPLIDIEGFVIGVNQSGYDSAQGINFAIPAEIVRYVVKELIEFGSVQRAALGVAVSEVTKAIDGPPRKRLVVTGVKGGDGLQVGDVLLAIAGVPIHDRGDLFRILSRDKIGKQIEVEVVRGDSRTEVKLVPQAFQT